jgi:putative membrane protein
MIISSILVGLVAVIHIYIMYLECFLWATPKGMKAFGLTEQDAKATKPLAFNQGFYNGFLAAGLIWGLLYSGDAGQHIQLFFLACVLIAGIVGSLTAKKSVLYIQSLPALLGIIAILFQW